MENEYPFLKRKTRPSAMLVRLCWDTWQKRSHMLSSIRNSFHGWPKSIRVQATLSRAVAVLCGPRTWACTPHLPAVPIFDATISNRRVECWQWMLSPLSDTMTSHISLAKESHVTMFNLYRTEECSPAGSPEAEESKTLVSSADAHHERTADPKIDKIRTSSIIKL